MHLLLIGCTGFIGKELVPQLLNSGHDITLISRQGSPKVPFDLNQEKLIHLQLDTANLKEEGKEVMSKELEKADAVINLAGEPIAEKRWTKSHCKVIEDSRIKTTQTLVDLMHKLKRPPKVLVNASAIGYYGSSQDQTFNEESPCGKDFLSILCSKWEESANKKPKSTRLIILRLGIVLGPMGGALKKMLPVFKAGLGGPIGDGSQWMSWIHRSDVCQIIEQSISNKSWQGVINCVGMKPVKMKDFALILGESLERPSYLPVPGMILKLLLGDGAKVVLEGQNVLPAKLNKLRYKFIYPDLSSAILASIRL